MVSGGTGGMDASAGGSDAAWRPPSDGPQRVEHLEGYTDLVEVGRGGDSVVYRARQESVDRDVAIKVLSIDGLIDGSVDPARSARFAREIAITVQLGRQHPNIVTVLATGTTASGRPAVVMDFFEGGTLHDRLKAHGPLMPEEVGRIGEVLADALAFAHERGVLHRDVKPQNVLVLPTSWVLADFGIARMMDAEHTSSAETFTYRHAAPQILDGHPPTPSDDVWSLGSTLYTLLDGRPPFASDDPDEDSALAYLRRARTEPHRPLDVPGAERLAPVIDRCLSKDVAGRWASAADLRDALHSLRASAWAPQAGPGTGPGPAPATRVPLEKTPVAPQHAVAPASYSPAPFAPPTPGGPVTPVQPTPVTPGTPLAPERVAEKGEPAPVAISAVSHVVRAADAEPTGTGLADDTGSLDDGDRPGGDPVRVAPGGPDRPDDESPRRRLPLILGAVALTIGLVLGIVGALLRDDGEDDPEVNGPQTGVVQGGEDPPTPDGTLTRRPDPDLAVVIRSFDYDGRIMTLSWTDPADMEGAFTLLRLDDDNKQGRPVYEFPPGTTSDEVEIELALGPACFYMVVATGSEYGLSDRTARCGTVTAFGWDPGAPRETS